MSERKGGGKKNRKLNPKVSGFEEGRKTSSTPRVRYCFFHKEEGKFPNFSFTEREKEKGSGHKSLLVLCPEGEGGGNG